MNMHHLGEQIDIHGGGNDLIFPHHENEIAQTEAITHKQFARYWMHNGMLQLKGEKMSKSLGNLVSIDEFLSQHPGDIMRLLVINAGYRSPLTFNEEVLEQTERAYERLLSAKKSADVNAKGISEEQFSALAAQAEKAKTSFIEFMDDDFNSTGAMAAIYDLVRTINQARSDGATQAQLSHAQAAFDELTGVLGLRLEAQQTAHSQSDAFIDLLVKLRTEMRTQKNWAMSDLIRDELKKLGVVLEDSKQGTRWNWDK